MFDTMSDALLLSCFRKAKTLRLDQDFIELLQKEMMNRGLTRKSSK
ncbi:sporulation histidine kinase inhibitor Sda [Lederbergia graminis]|uniref:Sporulation histidine kinase inhibitor Sda n=1 Tax=Lederbergia graminis TaxID=735518 RepID=A0ABW0LK58_9BACI